MKKFKVCVFVNGRQLVSIYVKAVDRETAIFLAANLEEVAVYFPLEKHSHVTVTCFEV